MKHFLTLLLTIQLFASCSKDDAATCETWEYRDDCTPKRAGVVCSGSSLKTGQVCDADLALAKAGQTKTVQDNADLRIVRTYIRKL